MFTQVAHSQGSKVQSESPQTQVIPPAIEAKLENSEPSKESIVKQLLTHRRLRQMSAKKTIRGRKALEHLQRQVTALQTCQITLKGQGSPLAPLTTTIASPPPRNHLTFISNIPLVPFSLLLLHKLQGWTDHRAAPEKHKQRKQNQDAADVRRLLAMQKMVKELQQSRPWTNHELFSEEFQELTKERVKEYCKEFPDRAASWQMLGFETV